MASITEEISVKLGIKTDAFNTALKEAGVSLKKAKADAEDTAGGLGKLDAGFSKMIKTLEVAAVVGFAKSILQNADVIDQMSESLGVNVETLQAFQREVRAANGTNEDANRILTTARMKVDDLRAGNEAVEKSFAALGLTVRDFVGLNLEQSLVKISSAYNENADRAGAYAALQDIVGKGGKNLMDVLVNLGETGLDPMIAKWKEAGNVIDEVTVKQLAAANKQFETMGNRLLVYAANVFGFVNDVVSKLAGSAAIVVNAFDGIHFSAKEIAQSMEATAKGTQKTVTATKELRESLVQTAARKKEDDAAEKNREQGRKDADTARVKAEQEALKTKEEGYKLDSQIRKLRFEMLTPEKQMAELREKERLLLIVVNAGLTTGNDLKAYTLALLETQVAITQRVVKTSNDTADAAEREARARAKTVEETLRQANALDELYRRSLRQTGDNRTLDDTQLQALRARTQSQLDETRREDATYSGFGTRLGSYTSPVQAQLALNLQQIKEEQRLRMDFMRTLKMFGETYAKQQYAPDVFDRLRQIIDPNIARQQGKDITAIATVLKRTFPPP